MPNSIPFRVQPMLASLAREPFNRKGWVFEEKYDGYRITAYKEGNKVQLISRNAIDRAARYPKIADAIRALAAVDTRARRRSRGLRPQARFTLSIVAAGLSRFGVRRV